MGPVLSENALYRPLYSLLDHFLPESLDWLAYLLTGFAIVLLLVNVLLIFASVFVFMLRRLLGLFQTRLGPNRVGPFGVLQPFADLLKLLLKEDVRPKEADPLLFTIAPVLMVAPVFIILAVVPFGRNSFLADLNVAVLFFIGVTTVSTLAVFLAGWGSGNRYALIGAVRAVAQLVSYEVPMVLSLVGVLLLAGTMSLVGVVEAQRIPFILLQPLGFFVFLMAASAEMNWTPFDLLEAESELTAGFHTEYSGTKFSLLQLGEFASVIVFSGIISTLFLRGWENPFGPISWPEFLPSHVWFIGKIFAVLFLLIWVRATIVRLRIDQVMSFAWKVLFPLAIINMFVTAGLVVAWPEPTTTQLWMMVAVNWVVAISSIAGISFLMEKNRKMPAATVRLVRVTPEVR
jgi:NADH-quinone oxidoreductase subunit H